MNTENINKTFFRDTVANALKGSISYFLEKKKKLKWKNFIPQYFMPMLSH